MFDPRYSMPQLKRADGADRIYHNLNRGNARAEVFRKPEDFDAFERILAQGLERYPLFVKVAGRPTCPRV
jgi:putative transposase